MFSQLKIYPPETTKGKGLSILTFPILLLVSECLSGFVSRASLWVFNRTPVPKAQRYTHAVSGLFHALIRAVPLYLESLLKTQLRLFLLQAASPDPKGQVQLLL